VKPPSDYDGQDESVGNTRGRIAFVAALITALLLGAYFSNVIYGNSGEGIAYLGGQLIGGWLLLSALTWSLRRATYTAAAVLAVAALSVGVANTGKLQEAIAFRDGKVALQGITGPKQIDTALAQNPSNIYLQLIAMASKTADETNDRATKLFDEIEPPSVSNDVDFGMASRNDLEILRRDVKAAEDNATAITPRYVALLKGERDKVESVAVSLHMEKDTINDLLVGIDKRHAKYAAFNSKMTLARADLYRAYGNYVAFLIGEFGTYKAVNGQLTFPMQRTADRYNVVGSAMNAAAKRVSDLDDERKTMVQSQQERWDRLVTGK
jgi:hypothetical protein